MSVMSVPMMFAVIAELHFYGEEGSGDGNISNLISGNIPTVVIHTVNNQDITSKRPTFRIISFIS